MLSFHKSRTDGLLLITSEPAIVTLCIYFLTYLYVSIYFFNGSILLPYSYFRSKFKKCIANHKACRIRVVPYMMAVISKGDRGLKNLIGQKYLL
jgi:hypothetical protein